MYGLFVLVFAKFSQHTKGGFGMQEGDAQAFGAATRSLVDEADAGFLGFLKLFLDALDGESDVVHATLAVVLLDEGGNGALGAGGLQQLNLGLAATQEGGSHLLVGDFFDGVALGPQQGFEKRNGIFQADNSDSNVFNVSGIHNLFE